MSLFDHSLSNPSLHISYGAFSANSSINLSPLLPPVQNATVMSFWNNAHVYPKLATSQNPIPIHVDLFVPSRPTERTGHKIVHRRFFNAPENSKPTLIVDIPKDVEENDSGFNALQFQLTLDEANQFTWYQPHDPANKAISAKGLGMVEAPYHNHMGVQVCELRLLRDVQGMSRRSLIPARSTPAERARTEEEETLQRGSIKLHIKRVTFAQEIPGRTLMEFRVLHGASDPIPLGKTHSVHLEWVKDISPSAQPKLPAITHFDEGAVWEFLYRDANLIGEMLSAGDIKQDVQTEGPWQGNLAPSMAGSLPTPAYTRKLSSGTKDQAYGGKRNSSHRARVNSRANTSTKLPGLANLNLSPSAAGPSTSRAAPNGFGQGQAIELPTRPAPRGKKKAKNKAATSSESSHAPSDRKPTPDASEGEMGVHKVVQATKVPSQQDKKSKKQKNQNRRRPKKRGTEKMGGNKKDPGAPGGQFKHGQPGNVGW